MDTPAPRPRTGLWLALVLVLAFGAYSPSLLNGFTFDDAFYAKAETRAGLPNPMVAELRPVAEYFRRPMNDGTSFTRGFRPVTVYSYALVHHLARTELSSGVMGEKWSDPAWAQHLLNLLLHVVATALVFVLVRQLSSPGPALLAALVFGVHAVHTEAIAWIVGRAEIFAFVFGMAGTLVYAGAMARRGGAAAWRLAVAALLFFSCFGSKESGVAWAGFAPVVVLALVLRQRPGTRWLAQLRGQALPWLVGLGIPLALFLWLRHRMLVEHVEPYGPYAIPYDHNPLFYMSALERLPSAVMLLGYGLYKTVLPISLSCSYRDSVFALPGSWFDLRVVAAVVVLGGWLFGAVVSGARHPLLLLGAAAFLGLSFVTSNIPVAVETIFAERFFYASSVGIALVVAWLATRASGPGRRLALAVPVAAWVVLCTHKSLERSFQWRDDLTLFEADVVQQPDSIELRVNLAAQQLRNFAEADAHANLRRAVEIQPESTQALIQLAAYLTNRLAFLKGRSPELVRERLQEVRELLERAQVSPRYVPAVDGRSVHVLLSRYYRELGDEDRFFHHVEQALQFDPRDIRLRLVLMSRAREVGDHQLYQRLLVEGERARPYCPYLAMERANQAHDAGHHRTAVEEYAASLPHLPEQTLVVEAWLRYARSLVEVGRTADALKVAFHCRQRPLPEQVQSGFEQLLAPQPPGR